MRAYFPPAQQIIVCFGAFRRLARNRLLFLRRKLDAQGLRDASGNFFLHLEYIFQFTVEALRPDWIIPARVHQLRIDAQTIPGAAQASTQNEIGIEARADFRSGQRRVTEGRHSRARKDVQILDLQQFGDDVLGHAVAEVFIFLRPAQIFEIEYGHGFHASRHSGRSRSGGRARSCLRIALEALQVGAHLRGRLITQPRVLLQGTADDAFQLRGESRIQALRRNGMAIENGLENYRGCIATKRRTAGSHFVQHPAERKQIAARVDVFSAGLFGRHIGDRADSSARTRQRSLPMLAVGAAEALIVSPVPRLPIGGLGESEIQNLAARPG